MTVYRIDGLEHMNISLVEEDGQLLYRVGPWESTKRSVCHGYAHDQDARVLDLMLNMVCRGELSEGSAEDLYKRTWKRVGKVSPRLRDALLAFNKEIYARKLRIPSDPLIEDDRLYGFLRDNHMDKKFIRFPEHSLRVENGDLQLLFNGTYISWDVMRGMIDSGEVKLNRLGVENEVSNLSYTERGFMFTPDLSNINLEECSTDELLLIARDNHLAFETGLDASDWGHNWIFSIHSETKSDNALRGEHSWIVLKNPDGEIFSFGFWRRGFTLQKHIGKKHWIDPWEFMDIGGNKRETDFMVNEEQWGDVLRSLLIDIRDENNLYDLLNENCATNIKDMLLKCGLEMNPQIHALEFFTSGGYNFLRRVPPLMKSIDVAINIIFYCKFKAGVIDPEVRPVNALRAAIKQWDSEDLEPHYRRFLDIFDSSKLLVCSPHRVGELQRLINLHREHPDNDRYSFPECVRSLNEEE